MKLDKEDHHMQNTTQLEDMMSQSSIMNTSRRNSSSSSDLSTSSSSACSSSGDEAVATGKLSSADTLNTQFMTLNIKESTANTTNGSSTSSNNSTVTSLKCHPVYRMQGEIRSGGFGVVYRAVRRTDNAPIAIKCIPKRKITSWVLNEKNQRIPKEIVLMQKANKCKGCIKILDYMEYSDRFHIVMERPSNCQDLWDYIDSRGPLSDAKARSFFTQILNTVLELRSCGIIHRDIKDDNILVDLSKDELKLIDFGAGTFYTDQVLREFAGTIVYSPPEWFLEQAYRGDQATVWSLGILLYNMIYGDIPFEKSDDIIYSEPTYYKRRSSPINHIPGNFTSSSGQQDMFVIDLIQACLTKNPNERIELDDIKNHPWLNI